ncbi:merozoite capping protein 1, putative [Plasmodium gallinaceum]|uniref:Peroxiredoxin, putative n=1 Tax=Plasmodium gallinaceum TaxID=5849 RepID=A0A1J1H1T6_PLAGA|nr:merozoite capping protein 1, putative [Plasmodium gallinaceum]CRG97286.1 merozoite capping protein 1, putative [Plasmodium gallinaceum]
MDQIKENKTIADSILKIDLLNEKNEKTNLYNEIKKNKDKNGMVIFIYPKANTPGCTKQAQLFKENFEKIVKNKYYVYGLSADSPKAQSKWKQKLNLQYDLLCDEEKKLLKEFGCLKGNSIIRSHLILRNDFNLSYFKKGVSPTSSADDTLNFLLKGEENGNTYSNENGEKKKSLPKINENEKEKNKKSVKVKKNKNGINKAANIGKKNEIKKNKNSLKELNNKEEHKKELKKKGKNKGENKGEKKKVKNKEVKKKLNTKMEDKNKKINRQEKKNFKIKNESKKQMNSKDESKKKIKNKEQKKELNIKGENKKELKKKVEKKKMEKKKDEIKKNSKIKDSNKNKSEIKNEKKVKKVLKKK